jgi:hypothetical protein
MNLPEVNKIRSKLLHLTYIENQKSLKNCFTKINSKCPKEIVKQYEQIIVQLDEEVYSPGISINRRNIESSKSVKCSYFKDNNEKIENFKLKSNKALISKTSVKTNKFIPVRQEQSVNNSSKSNTLKNKIGK